MGSRQARFFHDHVLVKEPGTDLYAHDDRVVMPDIDAHRADYRILGWALQPGDAIAFNFATIHGAPATATATAAGRRRVFSARWVGDGAVFVDRQGKGSPPFEGPDFPLVFSA